MSSASSSESEVLDTKTRSVLKIMFLTLFLDLVGFSIIFPLFPSMLEYYLGQRGGSGLLASLVAALERFTESVSAPSDIAVIVLFGGVLSSLYSMLQFLFAPILGSLSDRYGRRPVLLVSVTGILVSYALWFFAGSFALLILARTLGGIMSGNVSTASAVVADVTSARNRSKGMAVVGVAFGLGFILGPAIGGFSAALNLTERWPELARLGVNPFSFPALVALALSAVNLAFVYARFPETRPGSTAKNRVTRSINPLILFRTDAYPGVTKTNLTNFIYLTVFAGIEFSLTFLAMDRLGYGPRRNAFLFLFVGIVLVLVQGGYVRRQSVRIGPKKMCIHGLALVIPGIVTIGYSHSAPMLYAGLFLLAAGSGQTIPCLAALASVYTPPGEQGRVLGVFRSLGALGRGVGPLIACLLYWRLGATPMCWIGAISILVPLALAASLPQPIEK